MKKIYKAFSIITLSSIITRFISFVFKIYLSRYLGAETLGIYQIAFSIFLLLSCISTSGIGVTTSRLIAEKANSYSYTNKLVTSSLICSLIFAIIPIILIFCFPQFNRIFIKDSRVIQIIYILSPMFITSSLYTIFRSYLWGKKEFNLFSLTEMLDEIFKVLATIILVQFFAQKQIDKLYIYAIALIIGDVLLISILFIIVKIKKLKLSRPIYIKKIIKHSTPITISRLLASALSFFISIALPFLLVSKFNLSYSQATSEYGRASGMVMSLIFAPNAIISSLSIVLVPEIAELKQNSNLNVLSNKINYCFIITFIISCIFLIFFIGMGDKLGMLLYKDFYVGKYLSFSAIIVIPIGINSIVNSFLNTLNKEKETFYTYCISSIALIILILLLPKYIGIYAYFVALGVFHLINSIINTYLLNKCINIKFNTLLICFIYLLMSITISYLMKLLSNFLNLNLFLNSLILLLFGGALTILSLLPFYTYFFRNNTRKLSI